MRNRRRTHPVICFIALAAYLLNLSAAAGGAMLCQESMGETSIELAFDHNHCVPTVDTEHNHDFDSCWCSICPCEDTPLAIDVTPLLRDDNALQGTSQHLTFGLFNRFNIDTKWLDGNAVLRADHPPLVLDRSRLQIRTVVLIV